MTEEAVEGSFHRSALADMLSAALGRDKAESLIDATCRSLEVWSDPLPEDDVLRVLSALAEHEGLVGLAAGLAKSRLHFSKAAGRVAV